MASCMRSMVEPAASFLFVCCTMEYGSAVSPGTRHSTWKTNKEGSCTRHLLTIGYWETPQQTMEGNVREVDNVHEEEEGTLKRFLFSLAA